MKTIKFFAYAFFISIAGACSGDGEGDVLTEVESTTFENLFAPQEGGQGEPTSGEFTKFDFETGSVTTSGTDWDIAFRGSTIAVNGGTETGTVDEPLRASDAGVLILTGTFSEIAAVPANASFAQDSPEGFAIPTGSGNGWYNYDFATNILSPIPGKIFVIKTSEGKYAKVEILSYYKDAPASPNSEDEPRYYTFRYSYNPNDGQTTFN